MSQLLSQMFEAAGSILALPIVRVGFQLLAAYVVVLWLGAALWAFRDMRRRTTEVLASYGSAALIIVFTPVFFPAAVLIHLVMRPPETLEERSEHALRRSILEAEAVGTTCALCSAPVADDWLVCPTCANRLRRRCPSCDRLVELTWDICAWCGRDFRPSQPVLDGVAANDGLVAIGAADGTSGFAATGFPIEGPTGDPAAPIPEARPVLAPPSPAQGRAAFTSRTAAPSRAGPPRSRRRPSTPDVVGPRSSPAPSSAAPAKGSGA
jgi:hypothetical protein